MQARVRALLEGIMSKAIKPEGWAGICATLVRDLISDSEDMRDIDNWIRECGYEWSEFSGEEYYPVPGGYKVYKVIRDKKMLWDRRTNNAKARYRFAEYLLTRIEELV
jgi:hypothetical protein